MSNKIKQSIWKQTSTGEWKLFFNLDEPESSQISKHELPFYKQFLSTTSLSSKENLSSPHFKLGTLIMTPNGIGRIIKQDETSAVIKMSSNDNESTYSLSEISPLFPCLIKVYDREISNWFRFFLPAKGNVEQLKRLLDEAKVFDFSNCSCILVSGGTELKDDMTFEQLSLKPNAKIVICGLKVTEYKIMRFQQVFNWWYSYTNDGITFSTSKKIKLLGVGMYCSHEEKTQNGTLKLFEEVNPSKILFEESIEIPPAPDQANAIYHVQFRNCVLIKQNTEYVIRFSTSQYCYLYYGNGGKRTLEGEKGVEFYFKFTANSNHGTNVESGNFPVFYYSV